MATWADAAQTLATAGVGGLVVAGAQWLQQRSQFNEAASVRAEEREVQALREAREDRSNMCAALVQDLNEALDARQVAWDGLDEWDAHHEYWKRRDRADMPDGMPDPMRPLSKCRTAAQTMNAALARLEARAQSAASETWVSDAVADARATIHPYNVILPGRDRDVDTDESSTETGDTVAGRLTRVVMQTCASIMKQDDGRKSE
ncbi:hypothetical protein [Janibacter sp. HTCC2649]|uniref:hypothetical protein n=1 Tax=Janibacter sp. HTCC2649 TaxID=313589 RepID=UPI0011D21367|nr:hypothetical protein [Janibacter sp. HTCC2649]